MKQNLSFLRTVWRTRDWQAGLLLLLIIVIAGWLVLLPISQTVQRVSLERFHLLTPRFWQWAAQQPIPAMYNFENRYWASQSQLASDQIRHALTTSETARSGDEPTAIVNALEIETGFLNHFPARIVTFGQGRLNFLKERNQRWLAIQSRYQELELTTIMEAVPAESGGFRLERRDVIFQKN